MKDKKQGWAKADWTPNFRIEETADGVYLVSDMALSGFQNLKGRRIDTGMLGVTSLSGYMFELADGADFILDKDMLGNARNIDSPAVGPIETSPEAKRVKLF